MYKKTLLAFGTACMIASTNLFAVDIINAKQATNMTKQSTKALKEKLLKSKNGKEAYELLTKIINDGIKKITNGGFYNSFNLNVISSNELEKVEKLLKNNTEFDLMKSIVEEELIKKGYKVQRGKYDYSGSLHFYISWEK